MGLEKADWDIVGVVMEWQCEKECCSSFQQPFGIERERISMMNDPFNKEYFFNLKSNGILKKKKKRKTILDLNLTCYTNFNF